jgi:hypothetical protein
MRRMLMHDLGVTILTSNISRHLLGMLYIVKQTRVEPTTSNNEANKTLRQAFAKKLKQHQRKSNFVVKSLTTGSNSLSYGHHLVRKRPITGISLAKTDRSMMHPAHGHHSVHKKCQIRA